MLDEGSWPSLVLADRLDRPPGLDRALRSIGWRRISEEAAHVGRARVGRATSRPRAPIRGGAASGPWRTTRSSSDACSERTRVGPRLAAWSWATALASGKLRGSWCALRGEPIAVARLSQGDGVAGIHGLGVAREWRGQGYGTLLTTVATRAGMATGNRIVWLSVDEANEVALHVYRKLGFQHAFTWSRWLAPAGLGIPGCRRTVIDRAFRGARS